MQAVIRLCPATNTHVILPLHIMKVITTYLYKTESLVRYKRLFRNIMSAPAAVTRVIFETLCEYKVAGMSQDTASVFIKESNLLTYLNYQNH